MGILTHFNMGIPAFTCHQCDSSLLLNADIIAMDKEKHVCLILALPAPTLDRMPGMDSL